MLVVKHNSPTCPKCGGLYFSIPRMGISHVCVSAETMRLAEEASQRVFSGDVIANGVDFIVNGKIGDDQ